MSELLHIRSPLPEVQMCFPVRHAATAIFWLQGTMMGWMLVETAISLYAAMAAHSSAMLAFRSDSNIDLFSASVVLLQFVPRVSISGRMAGHTAGVFLIFLAMVVLLNESLLVT